MSDAVDLRAALDLASERLADLRANNAKLERTLLQPTAMRNRAIAVVVAAVLGGVLAYGYAGRAGDARAAAEREQLKSLHREILEASRTSLDSCKLRGQDKANQTIRCHDEREQLRKTTPPIVGPLRLSPGSSCRCEPGDPLCSCF